MERAAEGGTAGERVLSVPRIPAGCCAEACQFTEASKLVCLDRRYGIIGGHSRKGKRPHIVCSEATIDPSTAEL
jgi:hypothetical protein